MKTCALFFSLFLLFPLATSAQSATDVLQKVSTTLTAERWDDAVGQFRQAVLLNVDKSEMFYWTSVDKNNDVCPRMAQELASFYKQKRNYDKAYLFYKELLQRKPNDVGCLISCAEMEVLRGKENDALRTYEQVIGLDNNNLAANIFIGNYYYFMAEQEKEQIEKEYQKISTPTKMQYARYKDGLARVINTRYDKAKAYLQNVVKQFPSTEAQKTLDKIGLIEKESY